MQPGSRKLILLRSERRIITVALKSDWALRVVAERSSSFRRRDVRRSVNDAAVRHAELSGGGLLAMTYHEGLSMRDAVKWCGSVTMREVTRLRRLADQHSGG